MSGGVYQIGRRRGVLRKVISDLTTPEGLSPSAAPILTYPITPYIGYASGIREGLPVGTAELVPGDEVGIYGGLVGFYSRTGAWFNAVETFTDTNKLVVTEAMSGRAISVTVTPLVGPAIALSQSVAGTIPVVVPPASGTVIGTTSATGHLLYVPLPAGFVDTRQTYVANDRITVNVTAPSIDGAGNPTTITKAHRAGLRANVNTAENRLEIWMSERIPACATAVSISTTADAIRNSGVFAPVISGQLTNASTWNTSVIFRLVGLPQGQDDLRVAYSILDADFAVEAAGIHTSTIGAVKFELTQGGTTQVHWAFSQTRSRYRDRVLITPEIWAANGNGGLGVWSSGTISLASLVDGAVTITATAYAKVGGDAVKRSQTWTAYVNKGAYIERVRYVDSVAGLDTNDGLTKATAFQTLEKGCLAAGSGNGGATQFSIPIVKLVGSGTATKRQYAMYNGSGVATAIPMITDTWLTITPAEGHSKADVEFTSYISGGGSPRIRRLRFKDLSWDIAEQPGIDAISCFPLVNAQTTVAPLSEVAVWLDDFDSYHHNGRAGQVVEGSAGSVIGPNYSSETKAFFTNYTARNMGRRGHQSLATDMIRDAKYTQVQKDVFKEPECIFGFLADENKVAPEQLPVNSVTGVPVVGDVITGVFSVGSATVERVITISATNYVLILPAGVDSYTFKKDDSLLHSAVTVGAGEGAAFTVGETVNGKKLFRKDGDILRFADANGFTVGQTLTGATSGAGGTIAAIANNQTNLFFSISGARGTAGPPHPDGEQVQTFVNQDLVLTGITGVFQVGETVTAPKPVSGTNSGVVVRTTGTGIVTSGTNQWDLVAVGTTVTGATSGATGVYQSRSFTDNDANLLMANGIMRNIDGAILFAENGSRALGKYNILGIHFVGDADTTGLASMNVGNVPDYIMAHSTFPNRRGRTSVTGSDMMLRGEWSKAFHGCVWPYLTTGGSIQGNGSSTPDVAAPTIDFVGCHSIRDAAPNFVRQNTFGDPLWLSAPSYLLDYDPLAVYQVAPATGSPLFHHVPADIMHAKYDLYGYERPMDGTAAAGAIEAFPGAVRGTPGAEASEPSSMPDVIPAPFTAGMWTLTAPGISGQLVIEISSLPSGNVGGDVTGVEYRVNGGAYVALTGVLTDPKQINGLPDGTPVSIELRALNVEGPGPVGNTLTATPFEAAPIISAPVIAADFSGAALMIESPVFTPSTAPMFVAIMEYAGVSTGAESFVSRVTIGAAGRAAGTGTLLTAVADHRLTRAGVNIYKLTAPAASAQTLQVEYTTAPRRARIVALSLNGASGAVGAIGKNSGSVQETSSSVTFTTTMPQSLVLYAVSKANGEELNALTISGATVIVQGPTDPLMSATSDSRIAVAYEQAPGAAAYDMTVNSDLSVQCRIIGIEVLAT